MEEAFKLLDRCMTARLLSQVALIHRFVRRTAGGVTVVKTDYSEVLITFFCEGPSDETASTVFKLINEGDFIKDLEEQIYTPEFKQSFADVSDLELRDESQCQPVADVLTAFVDKASLRLSINLHRLLQALFSPPAGPHDITMVVAVSKSRRGGVTVDQVFNQIFPDLSEMLLRPFNPSEMSLAAGQ